MTSMPMSEWIDRHDDSFLPFVVVEHAGTNSIRIYMDDITSGEARRIGEFFRCLADVIA